MITEKQKQNEEMFTRDGAGRFIKIQDDEENKLNRQLTDREKCLLKILKKENKMKNKRYVNVDYVNEIFSNKTIKKASWLDIGSNEVIIAFEDDSEIKMYHSQDCCENVEIDDICGNKDLDGAVFYEIVEKECNQDARDNWDESFTWTFYTIKTSKGYTDIKWYGTSNGYYSESVNFDIYFKGEEDEKNR